MSVHFEEGWQFRRYQLFKMYLGNYQLK